MGFAAIVDALAQARNHVEVVERQAGELAGEDLDLGPHVESAVKNEAALAPDRAKTAGTALQIIARDLDVQALGQGLEFLEQLGISHCSADDEDGDVKSILQKRRGDAENVEPEGGRRAMGSEDA